MTFFRFGFAFSNLWKLCCSLKLTIWLAGMVAAVLVGGSLLLPANPGFFAAMDRRGIAEWLSGTGGSPLGWWVPLAGVLVLLLGLNAVFCFLDWLVRIRSRWRKTGEYLIHLGFVLIVIAYFLGVTEAFRSAENKIAVGETISLPGKTGWYLRLEEMTPLLDGSGRPMDMATTLTLLRGDTPVVRKRVRTNSPLLHGGFVILPSSFGRTAKGFRASLQGHGILNMVPGARVKLPGQQLLRIVEFYPDAFRTASGKIEIGGRDLRNPAFKLELTTPQGGWKGWYFLREGPPGSLRQLRIMQPVYNDFSVLTINYDPGAPLALLGSVIMLSGVAVALFSFYYKRSRGDRPEID